MQFFKRNPFGHILFIKKWIIRIIGAYSHRRYRGFNELRIEGSEIIRDLEDSNVLFISNHQTYFADVVAMFHVFNASLKGRVDSIKNIGYLWDPKLNIYFVKYICGVNYKVSGLENVSSNAVIVTSNHQSAWETLFFQIL